MNPFRVQEAPMAPKNPVPAAAATPAKNNADAMQKLAKPKQPNSNHSKKSSKK